MPGQPDDHKPHPSNIGKVIMLIAVVVIGIGAWIAFGHGPPPN